MNKWIEGMGKLMEKAKGVFLRTETKKREKAEERGVWNGSGLSEQVSSI
jgi:hypothetical protein